MERYIGLFRYEYNKCTKRFDNLDILYTYMGLTSDEAREIIVWDDTLHFQTMCKK